LSIICLCSSNNDLSRQKTNLAIHPVSAYYAGIKSIDISGSI